MIDVVRRQWFLLCLLIVFVLGFATPQWFGWLADARMLRSGVVATVLFAMALPLDTNSVSYSIRNPWPALFTTAVNIGVLPLVAWAASRLLEGDLRTGLLVTAAVPCTLASAAVWTRKAGGDDTVSILVTVLTNVTCFLTTPFWLYVTTGSQLAPADRMELAWMPLRLALLVLLPMGLAQLIRRHHRVDTWARQHGLRLRTFCQVGILIIVLAGATNCGRQLNATNWGNLSGIPLMCGCALFVHLFVLWIGMRLAALVGFDRPRQIAAGIAGSQKTLMVGLDIAISYFGGLAILPMVAYHFLQLTADTVIAERLSKEASGSTTTQ